MKISTHDPFRIISIGDQVRLNSRMFWTVIDLRTAHSTSTVVVPIGPISRCYWRVRRCDNLDPYRTRPILKVGELSTYAYFATLFPTPISLRPWLESESDGGAASRAVSFSSYRLNACRLFQTRRCTKYVLSHPSSTFLSIYPDRKLL